MRRAAVQLAVLALVPALALAQGSPVGPEFRVNTYTPVNEFGSAVAADALGNFVLVWQSSSQDGSLTGIFGQRYTSGGVPAGPEFRVNSYTTSNQFGSALASDASGNFIVVWTSQLQDGSNFGVFGQRYGSGGMPAGREFRVNTYTTGSQYVPAVSAAVSGSFVVTWMSPDGSDYEILAQRYAATGAPVGPEFRVNTYTTSYQSFPRIASDATGNFVVVWQDNTQDGSGGIFGQRYSSTGFPLGGEFRVNTYTTSDQSAPDVQADATGGFVVVWQSVSQDGAGRGVFGQRYAASGAPLGGEFRVNTYTPGDEFRASVAVDAAGNFVVVWQSSNQDGSLSGVFGQRYTSGGAPDGPEFRVNTYTTSDQFQAAVGSDPFGNFVVAWTSSGQDGSNYGVFGQRYSPIVPVELMSFGIQ